MVAVQGPGGRIIGRGTWHTEEDEALKAAVKIHGTKSWAVVSTRVPGRTGKQCRERWTSKLDPSVRQEPWSKQEDAKLISSQAKYGGRWSKIARSLPGRSEAAARQRFAILSQTKLPNSGLPLDLGKGKRERSPAISPPPPAPRPPTFYQELASPAIRGESHGGTSAVAPSLDVLASPSKRRRNLVLHAGSDGLLLPDDATSTVQQEQEGNAAPPGTAGTVAGQPGKAPVQPYTGADADVYDLIPTVPSWKAPDTPLEINVGDSDTVEDASSEDAAHWQRSTAAEMRSPLGDGDGMFSNNDEGRKALADVAKTTADDDADEAQLRRTAGFGSSAVAAVSKDLFLSLHQETEAAAAKAAAAAAGGVADDGVSVALARSCQNTTFCPQDEEFLYRRGSSVAFKPVPKTLLQGKDTTDFHAELHVPTDGNELQRTLTSSVLRDWATNTNTSRPSARADASETSTARDCGGQVGALLSEGLKKRQELASASGAGGAAVRLHESQKTALHRDLLWRLFWSGSKDEKGKDAAPKKAPSMQPQRSAVASSKGASINMLR